jgi:hypothetical protein
MDNFMRQQISQRASNSERLSGLIQQTKGTAFEEWRDDASRLFDSQLNDYSNKASEYVQNKISSTTEGGNILTNVPHFYSLGTGFYKNVLGQKGKTALDDTAKGIDIVKNKVNQKIAEKTGVNVEKNIGNIKTRVNNITDQLQGNTPETSTKVYQYRGVQTAETPPSDLSPQTNEIRDLTNNPFRSNFEPKEEIMRSSDPTLETRNKIGNVSERDPINTSEVTPVEQAAQNELVSQTTELGSAPYIGTANAVSGTEGISTFGGAATGEAVGETGLLAGTTELGAADAALAATGVGAPIAGLLAVGTAITFGLAELFHHHHHPKAPVMPYSSATPALTSQYNIGSTILPTASLQSRQGTMSF